MAKCNFKASKLNAKQCWPAVAPWALERGGLGFYVGV